MQIHVIRMEYAHAYRDIDIDMDICIHYVCAYLDIDIYYYMYKICFLSRWRSTRPT